MNERKDIILGTQLRKARKILQFRPEDVAKHLGVHRDEILNWEEEQSKPSLKQLENLSELYGREIDFFLKETPEPPTQQIQFRSITKKSFNELPEEIRMIIARFDELCRVSYEFEYMLDKIKSPELKHVSSDYSPVDLAREFRISIGLDEKPASKLRNRLTKKGIRIFELPIPQNQISGFSYWHQDYGPCIMINAKDVSGRRHFTLTHECAHLLYGHSPSVCDIYEEKGIGPSKEELLANIFAIEFLLPEDPIRKDFFKRNLSNRPSIQEVGRFAGKWNVSIQAMLYRLEDLELLRQGYANELLDSYKPEKKIYRHPKVPTWRRRLGETFVSNALEAYNKELISLGKLAHDLRIPLRKALEITERDIGERKQK